MRASTPANPRERLLAAAGLLSYTNGVSVGVQALCKSAGVSKRSMYQMFASKDHLLAASLQQRAADYAEQLLPDEVNAGSARENILHVFDQLTVLASRRDYHGCPYLAAQVEIKDTRNPAFSIARKTKKLLTDYFEAEAVRGGARDASLLARQLMLVFDGASSRAGIRAETLKDLVTPTAATLLDAADVH